MSVAYLEGVRLDILVEVKGTVRTYVVGAETPLHLEIPEGTTVGDVVQELGIPVKRGWNASIRRKLVSDTDVLHDGDRLMIFDVVGGG
jgi:sulfur carrier protein ThiS